MQSRKLIRDAAIALNKAIAALQDEKPICTEIGAARNWLDAARLTNPSQDENDQIHFWECLIFCLTNDYDGAYEQFHKANMAREVPPAWQELGAIIYAKMSPPVDFEDGLREYDRALTWITANDRSIAIAPVKAILYGRKAFYHLKMNRYADAVACCEIASESLPDHLAPHRIMAEINLIRREHERAIEYLSKAIAMRPEGPHPLTEERTFQLRFEISRPEPKKKPRKPKPRKPRARKPRVPTRTAEERIEARREYDKARSQTPERKEADRLRARQVRLERKEAGQCRDCSNEAIPGQTRCESCRDSHNRSR